LEGTVQMSKILAAMQKSAVHSVDFNQRLQNIDRGNLFPLPESDQAQEFEQLANSLINLHDGAGGKVVVFASTYSGEGCSYVSYNCAKYLTLLLNKKIAWVDGNFRNPHKKLNNMALNFKDLLGDPHGMPTFDTEPEFVIIGNGSKHVKTMDLLSGSAYSLVLRKLQESFHFTIIDASPIIESAEVAHLAQQTLGLVVVVQSQKLKYEVIQHGLDKMKKHNVNILGTVLNKRTFQLPEFIYRRL
jgi:Mrp family chromosome partitioning ATPase